MEEILLKLDKSNRFSVGLDPEEKIMRIGMMADIYKPHVSGVTNYISLNKMMLERLGHEVFVFTFGDADGGDGETRVIHSPGVPVVDTGYYFSTRYTREAKRLLQTMDIVHVHHPFVSGRLALRYCRPLNIPIIFTNHTRYDLYIQAYLPGLAEGIGSTFLQAYMPSFCRSMDLVIAPSPGLQKVLQNVGVDSPMVVVPNGVDLSGFRCSPTPLNRSDFDFSAQDVVLIYVGRLAPEKNLAFLLRSVSGVAQAVSNVKLLLVGGGPETETLKTMVKGLGIQDCVRFAGSVPYSEIPRYLCMSDAFVTASVTEVHPLSVIEAMAAGLPVMGVDSPGVGDTIEDGVTGFLTKEDMAAYTAKLVRLVSDRTVRDGMGTAAREAANRYSIERTTPMILKIYEDQIEHARNRRNGLGVRVRSITERWRN